MAKFEDSLNYINFPWRHLKNETKFIITKFKYFEQFYEIVFSDLNQCYHEEIFVTDIENRFQNLNPDVEIPNNIFLKMLDDSLNNPKTNFSFDNYDNFSNDNILELNTKILSISIELPKLIDVKWQFYGKPCDCMFFSDVLLKPLLTFNGYLIKEIIYLKSKILDEKNFKDKEIFKNIVSTENELKEMLFSSSGIDFYIKFIEYLNTYCQINSLDKSNQDDQISTNESSETLICSMQKKKKTV